MAAPLISVVIPCFNQGHFLADAVRSVRPSGTRSSETIVVDDGSTDTTAAVARQFSGVVYVRQSNRGLSSARNRGLAQSQGRYILCLDADDMLAPDALEIGAAALDAHTRCAFVTGRCIMMDAAGHLQPTPEYPPLTSDPYTELLRHNFIWMPAMAMFRRTALAEAGGFDEREYAAADYELYLRLARRQPAFDHARIVAYYRQHGANMSADAGRMLRETLRVHGRERPRLTSEPVRLAAFEEGRRRWQEFYGTRLVEEIRYHVQTRDWVRATRKAATLARFYPGGLRVHAVKKVMLWLGRTPPKLPDTTP
jgi:glycosyltransferase involved in cell wall biosynthesis